MGRQQFLTRLALGRSPFQDDDAHPSSSPDDPGPGPDPGPDLSIRAGPETPRPQERYTQQYDPKGRPVNPSIDQFHADLRAAQNEALALVGVVGREDRDDRLHEIRQEYVRERRTALLAEEDDRGELLTFVLAPLHYLSRMWIEAFVDRIQIGFYDPGRSISAILRTEWGELWTMPSGLSLAARFPGMLDVLAHGLVRIPLTVGAEQIVGRLQGFVQRRRLPRKTTATLYYAMSVLFEALLLAIDVAILPLEYHALAQRLHLAPALPLLPPPSFILPGTAQSFHSSRFGWRPLVDSPLIRTLTSPAFLLLASKIFQFDEDDDGDPQICALLTSYRYPRIDADPGATSSPSPTSDPFGCVIHAGYLLRSRLLRLCGWDLVRRVGGAEHEDNAPAAPPRGARHVHRSTHLAHAPARHLAHLLDRLYTRVLFLPLRGLVLRTVAATYLASPGLPKTLAARAASSRIHPPFGGISPDVPSWASHVSRIGLALCLQTAVDAVLFFGTHAAVRHVGRTFYDWGKLGGHIGIAGNVHGDVRSGVPDDE